MIDFKLDEIDDANENLITMLSAAGNLRLCVRRSVDAAFMCCFLAVFGGRKADRECVADETRTLDQLKVFPCSISFCSCFFNTADLFFIFFAAIHCLPIREKAEYIDKIRYLVLRRVFSGLLFLMFLLCSVSLSVEKQGKKITVTDKLINANYVVFTPLFS